MLLTIRGAAALVLPTVIAVTLPHAGLALLTLLVRLVVVQLHGLADLFVVLPAAALLLLAGLRLLLLLTIEILLVTHRELLSAITAPDRSDSEIARPI